MIKKIIISIVFLLMFYAMPTYADEITDNSTILLNDSNISYKVTDNDESTFIEVSEDEDDEEE